MRLYHYTILILSFSLIFLNCRRTHVNSPTIAASPVITTLQGKITSGNTPLAGATVKLGFRTTITNSDGFYKMDSAVLDKNLTIVTVKKQGYFNGIRTFQATSGTNEINISLLYKQEIGEFDNIAGGTISFLNYSKVEFTPNSIEKETGGSYSGKVKVYMAYLDPTQPYMPDFIPGSYLAQDKLNNRVTLVSYGMVGVELESPDGEKLQLAKRKIATLTTAIPASLQNIAPATISLWYMDESSGLWKEEGTATKSGDKYVGTVSHFSFWNCDVGVPLVNLTATLKDQNGNFLAFKRINLRSTNYGTTFATTDQYGQISGGVPLGSIISMEVSIPPCLTPFPLTTVGPINSNTNLGIITVTVPPIKLVSGRLTNCVGGPVTNGYAIVNYGPNAYFANVNANGEFTTELSICNTTSTSCQITGVDANNLVQGNPVSFLIAGGTTQVGNISACGNTSAEEFVTSSVNNGPVNTANSTMTQYRFSGNNTGVGDSTAYLVATTGGPLYGIYISFRHNKSIVAPSPLIEVSFDEFGGRYVPVSTINVILTSYPTQVGEFYTGSFSGQVRDIGTGVTGPILCSFRIRRDM